MTRAERNVALAAVGTVAAIIVWQAWGVDWVIAALLVWGVIAGAINAA